MFLANKNYCYPLNVRVARGFSWCAVELIIDYWNCACAHLAANSSGKLPGRNEFSIWFVGVVRRCLGSGRVSSQTKVTLATLFLRFRPQTTRRPVDSAESADGQGQRRLHGVIEARMRRPSFFSISQEIRVVNAFGQAVESKLRNFADFYPERFKVATAVTKVIGIHAWNQRVKINLYRFYRKNHDSDLDHLSLMAS